MHHTPESLANTIARCDQWDRDYEKSINGLAKWLDESEGSWSYCHLEATPQVLCALHAYETSHMAEDPEYEFRTSLTMLKPIEPRTGSARRLLRSKASTIYLRFDTDSLDLADLFKDVTRFVLWNEPGIARLVLKRDEMLAFKSLVSGELPRIKYDIPVGLWTKLGVPLFV